MCECAALDVLPKALLDRVRQVLTQATLELEQCGEPLGGGMLPHTPQARVCRGRSSECVGWQRVGL